MSELNPDFYRPSQDAIMQYLLGSSVIVGSLLVSILFIKQVFKNNRNKLGNNLKEAFHVPITEFENQAQNMVYAAAA